MELFLSAQIQWKNVGLVLGIVAGLALVLSVLILITAKLCKIKGDEKVSEILEHLAGANCGVCGFSGCEGFAKALAEGRTDVDNCKVTSPEEKKAIAEISGVPYVERGPSVAVVNCSGGANAADKFSYLGNDGCENMSLFHDGQKLCPTGCLGGGTCVKVCPVGAIRLKNGVAVVDKTICIACGRCVKACPKGIISLIPAKARVYVACSTHLRGKEAMSFCSAGCIGCGLCAKNCPEKAITMKNFLPVFDYDKCTGCFACVEKCPRKVIKAL